MTQQVASGGDKDSWAAAASAVLRKSGRLSADAPDSDAWDVLARTTVEGLTVPPLGTPARSAGLPTAAALSSSPGRAPFLRGSGAPGGSDGWDGWDVRSMIDVPDADAANTAALADLEGGACSLWVRLGDGGPDPDQLPAVLAGVHLDMAPVVLQGSRPDTDLACARALADLARSRRASLHPDGNVGADPIGRVADAGFAGEGIARSSGTPDFHATVFRDLPQTLALAQECGVRALVVDGTVAHDAGAGDAAEIGYVLAAGAAYLRALTDSGLDVDTACGLLDVRFAVTDEQFVSIAKLRAARLTWHRMTELCGAAPLARAQRQHAVTSPAMLTRYDPWVNLLRTTVAAFAAGVGGARAVTVLPFDSALGIPDAFGRRMARNVSALLLGESHLGAVADPAGGSHAVEMLTAEMADAAWAEFDRIEAAGGILAALANDSLTERYARTRAARDRRIATRRQPITGVSEFPHPGEELPRRRPAPGVAARRWAQPFELLRDDPPGRPVLLVTVGAPAAASPRLLFARNLLAAGGITVVEPPPGGDVAAAVTATGGGTVVLAGSDADYAAGLETAASSARAAGATAVFVAGRPATLDGLPEGLVDGSVAVGDDVLAFLHAVRATLGGEQS